MYEYYSSEIINALFKIIKESFDFKDSLEDYQIFLYIFIKYIVENKNNFTSIDYEKYKNNQDAYILDIFFNSNFSLSEYFTNYIMNKNKKLFFTTINGKNMTVDISHNKIQNLIYYEFKLLTIRNYVDSYQNKCDLFNYIKNFFESSQMIIENEKQYKKLPKNKIQLYIIYRRIVELNKIFLNNAYSFTKESKEMYLYYMFEKDYHIQSIKEIKEKDIEKFLCSYIELLNENYYVVGRQIHIEDGIIDILCRDYDDNYIIIELKNKQSKSIIWQSLYYPKEIRKTMNINNKHDVKFIAFCPDFNYPIKSVLEQIDNVEMVSYKVVVDKDDNIVDLIIDKINNFKDEDKTEGCA